MITVKQVGAEAVAGYLSGALREFQKQKRVQMRKAALLLRKEVVEKLESGSPLKQGQRRRFDAKKREIGPLHKRIKAKTFNTTADVGASITYNRRGFYGRFHETGLNTVVTRQTKNGKTVTYRFKLPRRQVLEPVAKANEAKVVEILGDAYKVFVGGGSGA